MPALRRAVSVLLLGSLLCWVQAQTPRQVTTVAGVVLDPTGALVPGAKVLLITADDADVVVSQTRSGAIGEYRLSAAPGAYIVAVEAAGFARAQSGPFRIDLEDQAGGTVSLVRTVNVRLRVAVKVEQIQVPGEFDADDSRAGSSVLLSEREVGEMPLDGVALLQELQGLAGSPYAQLYVDGFSGAKLPPRDSIRAIRINQNPYSAENDTDPVNGVIQVLSKPGTNQLHGELYVYGDDSALNAGDPFAPNQPPYFAYGTGGSVSGPLDGRASYYASWDQLDQRTNSAVDAQALDANLNQAAVDYAVASPRTTLNLASRMDVRAGADSTMTVRYEFDRATQNDGGVGQLALASQGFDNTVDTQTLRLANSQVIGAKMVNETRFQYIRSRTMQTPVSSDATILVEGAFGGGGSSQGIFSDHLDRYELQNYLSLAAGRHYFNFGGRLRVGRDANRSQANYNGEFIFSTLSAYQITLQGMANGDSFAQILAAGGGASQFSLTAGNPNAAVTLADAAVFAQDDWKARENLTLSYGVRFETQTYIADHADWAPRLGIAWGLGGRGSGKATAPRYVVRGGAGIFYRRFGSDSALQVQRQNGVSEQEYVAESPQFCPSSGINGAFVTILSCPGVPKTTAALAATPTVYRVSPNFHAPYFIEASAGVDRHFGRIWTVSATYLNSHGVHTQVLENANAPLPGTYTPGNPASGVRPLGNENIYQYTSEGVYRSNQLTTNVTARAAKFAAYGIYVLRYAKSDSENGSVFPSNSYDLGADYARSLNDVRHTVTAGGSVQLPYGIHSWGYLQATSGAPFDILVGQDLNGDSQFNDRPAFATDLTRSSVVATRWGTFDTNPTAGQTIIPRNYGQGPGLFLVNLAMGKSFAVGPEVGPPSAVTSAATGPIERKYTVDFWVQVQNLLNHPNLTPPVGTLNSPLFGHSIGVTGGSSLSADRVVDLQLSLRF
jgi:hypothetical protein